MKFALFYGDRTGVYSVWTETELAIWTVYEAMGNGRTIGRCVLCFTLNEAGDAVSHNVLARTGALTDEDIGL